MVCLEVSVVVAAVVSAVLVATAPLGEDDADSCSGKDGLDDD